MKTTIKILGLAFVLFATACSNDDEINMLNSLWRNVTQNETRIDDLEKWCAQANTNITSLQTIVDVLQSNDFITSIVEIKKDGKVVGYTITFGKHDPITIYHGQNGKNGQNGQDGQNGADGKDGITPVIGVAQDTDGVYYWTLNGEWLLDDNGNKLPVSGKDGQNGTNGSNGQDGTDGKDGQDGKDGADGKDGVTPQLKIEDGYWYISYDNGATWTQLGKATGENGQDGKDGADGEDGKDGQNGADGKDGQDGDSMFQSVTQDENYVYFTLADGTVIKIAKASEEHQPNSEFMFIITYDANGGEGTMKPDTFYYGVSKQLSEIKYTKSSHYFTNWNTKADGTGIPYEDGQTLMISKNITLYAQWEVGNKELFSVSESTTITFSPGNLSYNSSTKKWSFASSLGGGSLLGWSGSRTYNYGVSTSPTTIDYTGDFVDWGNLTIDSYPPKTWRTLTSSEWRYVLNKRKNASDKKGVARVNGISGLILLPDFWECPKDINFVSGFVSTDFTNAQSFTTEQWALLENAGAIFLPASGTRWNTNTSDYGKKGSYWTPDEGTNSAICMEFTATSIASSSLSDYPYGKSVRLVKDIQ